LPKVSLKSCGRVATRAISAEAEASVIEAEPEREDLVSWEQLTALVEADELGRCFLSRETSESSSSTETIE
jgi:hypothetical protein